MTGLAAIPLESAARTTFDVGFVVAGSVVAVFGLYLLVLSIASFFYSGYRERRTLPATPLVVLVPAHNEAALIARCVRSLRAQTYPAELYRVVVVADNCTDETAAIAAAAGAHDVMTRDEPDARGKGRALRWAMDRLLAQDPAPAAIAVVDADSVADSDFLVALVRPFEAGARAVQGESLLCEDGSARTALRVVAFLLINRVRPTGRAVLHLPTNLAGNGMLFARDLLAAKPWEAFTSAEDLEYGLQLHMAGIQIVFAGGAVLLSPPAPNPQAAAQQQLRWEGGKAHLARAWIPRLIVGAVRDRRPALLGAAFELAVPPLALLAAAVVAGTAAGASLALTGLLSTWALAPWLIALGSLPLFVLVGLRAGRASTSGYRAMARAPLFILTKPLRAPRVLSFPGDTWVRTERAAGEADDGTGHPGREVTTEPGTSSGLFEGA